MADLHHYPRESPRCLVLIPVPIGLLQSVAIKLSSPSLPISKYKTKQEHTVQTPFLRSAVADVGLHGLYGMSVYAPSKV
jgi:hypothetical protein